MSYWPQDAWRRVKDELESGDLPWSVELTLYMFVGTYMEELYELPM